MNQEEQSTPVAPAPMTNQERDPKSMTDLIRHLATDLSTLLSKEVELAKAEVGESVSEAKLAVSGMATGGVISIAGLVVLLMSAVYGLSNVVAPWLAALVVGAAALIVGLVMASSAKKKLSARALVPERTLESAKKDKKILERAAQ